MLLEYWSQAMRVYVNYPQPHFTIHQDPECNEFKKHKKEGQRLVRVDQNNLGDVLIDFVKSRYQFKSEKSYNDLWFDISLDTKEQEIGFTHIIKALLGKRYKPFTDALIVIHC